MFHRARTIRGAVSSAIGEGGLGANLKRAAYEALPSSLSASLFGGGGSTSTSSSSAGGDAAVGGGGGGDAGTNRKAARGRRRAAERERPPKYIKTGAAAYDASKDPYNYDKKDYPSDS